MVFVFGKYPVICVQHNDDQNSMRIMYSWVNPSISDTKYYKLNLTDILIED